MASQGECLLVVSENGYGKRTPIDEFTAQNRGGKGVRCYKIIEKTGDLVGAKLVDNERKIMLITNEGIIIKMAVSDISIIGRPPRHPVELGHPDNNQRICMEYHQSELISAKEISGIHFQL